MTERPTKNKVALKLEQAAKNSPYSLEKDNYQMAVDEIRRLQACVDEIRGEENPDDGVKTIYEGDPWHADEDGLTVRMFCGYAQVFKAPKRDTPYEEYWPTPEQLTWMLQVLNQAEMSRS
jgi:hypothetical protein